MLVNKLPNRILFLVVFSFGVLGNSFVFAQHGKPLPSFKVIEEVVNRYFASLPGYKSGNIISRSETEPLFEQLKLLGWKVPDRRAILNQVLPDSTFIVRELRKPAGKKFMRQIAKYPGAYDQLDRLSRLPYGRKTVLALINGKGGYEMIKYMTTSKGGAALGKQLSNSPKGTNFNKPTGRIYTVKMLLAKLKEQYTITLKRLSAPAARR